MNTNVLSLFCVSLDSCDTNSFSTETWLYVSFEKASKQADDLFNKFRAYPYRESDLYLSIAVVTPEDCIADSSVVLPADHRFINRVLIKPAP